MKRISLIYLVSLIMLTACSENNTEGVACETVCEYTLTTGETEGTVPTSLDGTYILTYGFAQPGSPFDDGVIGTFTISNNELTVDIEGFDCITLRNPVLLGTNNYKFKDDCRDNIAYNVSPNNNGSFNEINIEPLGTGFFGQFFSN